jgi:hypothetical protein
MKRLVPCLLVAGLSLAATGVFAKTVVTGGNDDQRVSEGVSGPVEAAKPANKAGKADNSAGRAKSMADKDRARQKKVQHPPPPPLHDPN